MHIRRICRRCWPERIFTSPERISIVIAEREGGSGGVSSLAKFAVLPINGRFFSGEGVSGDWGGGFEWQLVHSKPDVVRGKILFPKLLQS